MLRALALILLLVWALAMAPNQTMGGFVHALIMGAAAVVVFRVIGGRRWA